MNTDISLYYSLAIADTQNMAPAKKSKKSANFRVSFCPDRCNNKQLGREFELQAAARNEEWQGRTRL